MGFGGGGGGQLSNHVHNSVPLQGGPLDFSNNTIAGMAAGDITYSDGAALQILNAPGVPNNEVLTFAPAATAPSWVVPAAGSNNRVILDSQTFATSTVDTITFTPGSPIDDSVYQKIQIVFTGNGLGNNIDRAMFRLDSGLSDSNYNENSTEIFAGAQNIQDKNPQTGGDDYVRLTDVLASSGLGWIITVDLQIPPATATGTTLWYQVATEDRVAMGSGWVTGLTAGQIGRIQIEMQNATNNKDMQFTVYGIKF
jgi:hypothetical protein